MDLWNEYEGRTIDGRFPLQRLIRPEGRSAFFSTSNGNGGQAVIRLIESHYDDDAILARWQAVSGLHQEHLLNLNKFGHAVMDDTELVYAVLEPTEADLGEILAERALTEQEARELAGSVVAALEALHSIGMVHEHVLAMNVLAVGETIKLRSDCVREAPEGAEGEQARARDVYDLAMLLLQALTLDRDPKASLPAPFGEIVQHGLSGRWGLAEIGAKLVPTPVVSAIPVTAAIPVPAATPVIPAATSVPVAPNNGYGANEVAGRVVGADYGTAAESAASHGTIPRTPVGRTYIPVEEARPERRLRVLAVGAALLVALCFLLWHLSHRQDQAAIAPSTVQPAPAVAQPQTAVVAKPSASPASVRTPVNPAASWRVVAFTYNREGQAQAKAERLGRERRDLHFGVFSPSGRAPWLVTVGGELTKEQALTMESRLRGRGLPRDLYARDYGRSAR